MSNNTALVSLDCGAQDLHSLDITPSGNADYPYKFSFSDIMSSEQFTKVSNVRGIDSEDNDILTTYSDGDGVAQFASIPKEIDYTYDTGYIGSDGIMGVYIFDIIPNIEINAANFPDDNFSSYVSTNFDTDGNGILSASEIANVQEIYVNDMSISSLTGIEHFTALEYLQCYGNQLTALDISKNTALTELRCQNNQLTALDLSKNTALTAVQCYNNQLTSLNVSSNTALTSLRCQYNQLTALDVSHNTALSILYCNNNQLKALDVSSNTALSTLDCTSQTVSPLTITSTGDSSYPYQLDFSSYMSSDKFANVSDVQGLDSNSADITTTYADGVAKFAALPAKVTYNYTTGYSTNTMDVTISGSDSSSASVSVNEANFPDSNFRSYIISNFDTDNNGVLSDTEISNITEIQADNQGIQSLKGIENFTALEYLSCGSNDISSLDVSKNTTLTYLNFWDNNVSSIDLSQSTALKEIYFYDNNISSVDFSGNTEIISIDCVHNGLRYIDVSGCTKLEFLNVYDNLLTELDVSNCTLLNNLSFGSNDVSEIDLSNNPLITYLGCNENRLATLDLSGISGDITEIYIDNQSVYGMTVTGTGDSSYPYQLDLSAYMSPDKFANVSDVQGIDSGNANITTAYVDGIARFASYPSSVQYNYTMGYGSTVMDVTISGAASSGDVEINAVNFPDDNFRSYVRTNFDTNNDGILSASEIAAIESISIEDSSSVSSLKGIECFAALRSVHCAWNQLTELDVSKNTVLTSIYCSWNQLTTLDVSNNTALTYLGCWNNQLTALDVTKNTALTSLQCGGNQLTVLDVSKNTALTTLSCGNNQLTVLDVSKNTALTGLYCHDNQLTTLDVSHNTALTTLWCGQNQLTALDVTKNTDLTDLYCGGNQLTVFDVSKNTALTTLHCDNNQLTVLDVSKNTALTGLYCYSNQLTTLDISYNTALTYLWCNDNQLTVLDVSKHTALNELYCYSNHLTTLDVSYNTALTDLRCYSQDVSPLTLTSTGDTSYPYQLDFVAYMSSAQFANISGVQGLDSSGSNITTTYSSGIARFAARPSSVKYNYATGYSSALMDVTISGSDSSPVPAGPEISTTNFPDSTFRSYISANFDTDGDGVLSDSEIANITHIYVNSMDISSLAGVEYFTALTELWCWDNQLTTLDVSNNTALNVSGLR